MPFADLLRRSSPHVTNDSPNLVASSSYRATPQATSSSSRARERSFFGRAPKSRPCLDSDGDLLYPTHPTHLMQSRYTSGSRASHYSSTDDHNIGHAPARSDNLTASLPQGVSSPDVAPSSLTTTSSLNRYDRLFGPSPTSAPVSPRPSPIPLGDPLPPSASTSASLERSRSSSANQAPQEAPATTLLRRKSTKTRSPFPPASSSTGTSSTLRDNSTMGSAIFRRPSLRRRTGSADSSASRKEKTASASTPPVEPRAASSSSPAAAAALVAAVVSRSGSISRSEATNVTTGGRLARLFGRRKSISGPINVLAKPDLVAHPVPVLQEAYRTVNVDSPPLAVITGWQQEPVAAKPSRSDADHSMPVSPRAVSPPDAVSPANNTSGAKLTSPTNVDHATSQFQTVDSASSKVSTFTFPARTSTSNDSSHQLSSGSDPLRSRQTKHSTSHSVPLASMPISNPMPVSASHGPVDVTAMPAPQRRPARLGRSLSQSMSHRKSSKSLSMIGSLFGSSSQAELEPSPPLPSTAAALVLAQSKPAPEPSPTSNHTRKPSLRARLKIGSRAGDQGPQRPSTPEIESWKGKVSDPNADGASPGARGRSAGSADGHSRPKPADSPIKIVRSKSMIRRKPPPEVRQEEIDSSSSTPVYGMTFRTLDVDHHSSTPLGGSPASSPEALSATFTAGGVRRGSTSPSSQDALRNQGRSESSQLNSLGLIGASGAASEGADASIPSIDVRPSTPSREASPKVATEQTVASTQQYRQKLVPILAPAPTGKRLSSGTHSIADTSMSVDRPWSLISASEADTPLLKLQKLVVDTGASDDSRDGESINDRLFFRPLNGATREGKPVDKIAVSELTPEDAATTEVLSESDAEELRSSSQTTMRSDTKHEIASIHSTGSSTVRAVRGVTEQPSVSGLSAASGALEDASPASTLRGRLPAMQSQQLQSSSALEANDRDADSVGPLPAKSPAASQHSLRNRQHRRDGSVGSANSQATIQQARRSSTASRLTARSSGHWSESRLSEDALSALEAEVGQARRAEVVALGKGRVKDWVTDRPLPTADAPTLSRSNTLRRQGEKGVEGKDREAQRQRRLNDQLDRKLQQLSESQADADAVPAQITSAVEIRDIPDEDLEGSNPKTQQEVSGVEVAPVSAQTLPRRYARLSAFHDRKMMGDVEQAHADTVAPVAASPSRSVAEEAIRLGRAPSKRVRRNASETRSVGEAVMVERGSAVAAERDGGVGGPAPRIAARHLRRSASLSSKKKASAVDSINPTLVPALPSVPVPTADVARDTQLETAAAISSGNLNKVQDAGSEAKKHSKQRSYATSEEAARARQLELMEREKRHAEREARRQVQLQQKYALKKQSDPLLAARLALMGLEAREAMPQVKIQQAASRGTGGTGSGPPIPPRRASSHSPQFLSVAAPPVMRKDSNAGSVASFHTALDAADQESAGVSDSKVRGEATMPSKASGEVRPDTSYSVASSLAVDFEFPVPPQRMKEQLSDDGTVLSRAGLQHTPEGERQWRERRHFGSQAVRTPTKDAGVFSNDELASVSPLDSVKQTVSLRRSRSVGCTARDVRRLERDQMRQDAERHPSPKRVARGLGIELGERQVVSA